MRNYNIGLAYFIHHIAWAVNLGSMKGSQRGDKYSSDILLKSRIMANHLFFCFLLLILGLILGFDFVIWLMPKGARLKTFEPLHYRVYCIMCTHTLLMDWCNDTSYETIQSRGIHRRDITLACNVNTKLRISNKK